VNIPVSIIYYATQAADITEINQYNYQTAEYTSWLFVVADYSTLP